MQEKIIRVIEVAVQPKMAQDAVRLSALLTRMTSDDPRLQLKTDAESGLTILAGVSEAHLEEKIALLSDDIPIDFGSPQAIYFETISKPVSITYTYKRALGSSGEFAQVSIDFMPLEQGSGFVFENAVAGNIKLREFIPAEAIHTEFVQSVERGLSAQKESGLLAGFPMIDFKAVLTDYRYHEIDSTPRAFDIAARAALRELDKHDAVQLLEPVMKIEVVTPSEFLGGVVGDLNSRRANRLKIVSSDFYQIVTAFVPVASLFGYGAFLEAISQRRAIYSAQFDHYEPVPSPTDPDSNFPSAMAMRVA